MLHVVFGMRVDCRCVCVRRNDFCVSCVECSVQTVVCFVMPAM